MLTFVEPVLQACNFFMRGFLTMTKLFLGFSDEVVPCSSVIGGAGQALRHDWPLLPCRVSCRGPPQNEGHQVQGHHRPFPCRERDRRGVGKCPRIAGWNGKGNRPKPNGRSHRRKESESGRGQIRSSRPWCAIEIRREARI